MTQTTLNTDSTDTQSLTTLPGIGTETADGFGLKNSDTPTELKTALQNDNAHRLQNISTQYIDELLDALDLDPLDTGAEVIAVTHGWRFHRDKHGATLRRHRNIPGFQITNNGSSFGDGDEYWTLQVYRGKTWGWQTVTPLSTDISLEDWDALLTALDEDPDRWGTQNWKTVQQRISTFLDDL